KLLAKVPDEARADEDTAARLSKLSKSVEADADRMLDGVKPLIDKGDYGAAIARLKDLTRALSGTPVAAKARRQLSDLLARPDVSRRLANCREVSRSLALSLDISPTVFPSPSGRVRDTSRHNAARPRPPDPALHPITGDHRGILRQSPTSDRATAIRNKTIH